MGVSLNLFGVINLRRFAGSHCFVFPVTWLLLFLGLTLFPGFELKALIVGTIFGYWPMLLFGEIRSWWGILMMVGLFLLQVSLIAGFMDYCKLGQWVWGVLFGLVLVGMVCMGSVFAMGYDQFQSSIVVHAFPEGYGGTPWDYYRLHWVPGVFMGGMYGLYSACMTGVAVIIVKESIAFVQKELQNDSG